MSNALYFRILIFRLNHTTALNFPQVIILIHKRYMTDVTNFLFPSLNLTNLLPIEKIDDFMVIQTF